MPYLVSLNPLLFKNIACIGSWKHFVFAFFCVCVSWSFSLSFCMTFSCSLSSPDDKLSENIWFRTSYSGDKLRCHRCGTDELGKIGLLSQWTLGDWVLQFTIAYNSTLWRTRSTNEGGSHFLRLLAVSAPVSQPPSFLNSLIFQILK